MNFIYLHFIFYFKINTYINNNDKFKFIFIINFVYLLFYILFIWLCWLFTATQAFL